MKEIEREEAVCHHVVQRHLTFVKTELFKDSSVFAYLTFIIQSVSGSNPNIHNLACTQEARVLTVQQAGHMH